MSLTTINDLLPNISSFLILEENVFLRIAVTPIVKSLHSSWTTSLVGDGRAFLCSNLNQALCHRLTDSDISNVITLLHSNLQFLDLNGCQSLDGDCLTSLERTSSTIKHVYLAKTKFRQSVDQIADKLKSAFEMPDWSAMVVLPFYFDSDCHRWSVGKLIEQYGDFVILRAGGKLLYLREVSEMLCSQNRILRQNLTHMLLVMVIPLDQSMFEAVSNRKIISEGEAGSGNCRLINDPDYENLKYIRLTLVPDMYWKGKPLHGVKLCLLGGCLVYRPSKIHRERQNSDGSILFTTKFEYINVECCMPGKWSEEVFAQVKRLGMHFFDTLPEMFPNAFILFTSMEICSCDDYFRAIAHLYKPS